jgi:hypothetical protein
MSVALQIRDVPEEIRDVLAREAAHGGQSLQAYLLALVQREARVVRNRQTFERTAHLRVSIPPHLAPEDLIREGREEGFDIDRESDQE